MEQLGHSKIKIYTLKDGEHDAVLQGRLCWVYKDVMQKELLMRIPVALKSREVPKSRRVILKVEGTNGILYERKGNNSGRRKG